MASYRDYYNGVYQPPAKTNATRPAPVAPVIPPMSERYYQPAPAPLVDPRAPKPRQMLRTQNSMGNPLGSQRFYTPGQGVTQANPFAAMLGMFGGGAQQPGYGYQAPQSQQYANTSFLQPAANPVSGGSSSQYTNWGPGSFPTGPAQARQSGGPSVNFAYGAPQSMGNPYLPRQF